MPLATEEIAMKHSASSIVALGLLQTLIMAGPAFAQSASESMHEAENQPKTQSATPITALQPR
jgi:hypothetical protein